jgi:predicted ATPase/DNA-binding XRE family transcriptional regulator
LQADDLFRLWLREQRKVRGLTQAQLAQQAGCASITLRKIEAGAIQPSVQLRACIARALARMPDEDDTLSLPAVAAPGGAVPTALLPTPLTPLLGREREKAAVQLLIAQGARLVTITGTGGVGKTRLALEIAREIQDCFPDGVWFVDLAPVSDQQQLAATILQTLGIARDSYWRAIDTLKRYFQGRKALLLLDNFEHLLEAAPLVSDLLRAAPPLTALLTSRVALRLGGEQEFAVGPLAVAPPAHWHDPNLLVQAPAFALFLARAQAIDAAMTLTPQNGPVLAEICTRLQGLPLALELAAVRAKLFTPEQLLALIQEAGLLSSLGRGPRDAPLRQQSLRATLEWSYRLLDVPAQSLLRRLAVFRGGWTFAAAQAIAAPLGDAAPGSGAEAVQHSITAALGTLIDSSLVYCARGSDGAVRYNMLEPIREYAAAQLAASGQEQLLHERHLRYFVAQLPPLARDIGAVPEAPRLRRLDNESSNFNAALEWSISQAGRSDLGLVLAARLGSWWFLHGQDHDGATWMDRLLDVSGGQAGPGLEHAQNLYRSGRHAMMRGDIPNARQRLEQARERCRELGDETAVARLGIELADLARETGDYAAAVALAQQTLAQATAAGDLRSIADSCLRLGQVALFQGQLDCAEEWLRTGLRRCEEANWPSGGYVQLFNLSRVTALRGDLALAQEQFEAYLAQYRAMFNPLLEEKALIELGRIARAQTRLDVAAAHFSAALKILLELQLSSRDIAVCVEHLAGISAEQGDGLRAAELLGAAEHLREQLLAPVPPIYQPQYEHDVAVLRNQLGTERFRQVWQSGRSLSVDALAQRALKLRSDESAQAILTPDITGG